MENTENCTILPLKNITQIQKGDRMPYLDADGGYFCMAEVANNPSQGGLHIVYPIPTTSQPDAKPYGGAGIVGKNLPNLIFFRQTDKGLVILLGENFFTDQTILTNERIGTVIDKTHLEAQRTVVIPTSLDEIEPRGLYVWERIEREARKANLTATAFNLDTNSS